MLKTYLKYFVNLLWKPNRKAQTVYVSNTGSNQNFTYVTYIAPCDGYATLTASAYNNDSVLHGGQIAFFIAKDADKIGSNNSNNLVKPFEISENFYASEFWKRNYLPVVKGDIITARVYCWNADMSTVNVSIEFMKKLGGGTKLLLSKGDICLNKLSPCFVKSFCKTNLSISDNRLSHQDGLISILIRVTIFHPQMVILAFINLMKNRLQALMYLLMGQTMQILFQGLHLVHQLLVTLSYIHKQYLLRKDVKSLLTMGIFQNFGFHLQSVLNSRKAGGSLC